jgi:hypothetical protein
MMVINNFLTSSEFSIGVIYNDASHFLPSLSLNFSRLCYLRRVFIIFSYTCPVLFQSTYKYVFPLILFNNLLWAMLRIFIIFIDKRDLIIRGICFKYFTCWMTVFLLVWEGILAEFTLFFLTPHALTVFLAGHFTFKIAFSQASISYIIIF